VVSVTSPPCHLDLFSDIPNHIDMADIKAINQVIKMIHYRVPKAIGDEVDGV
jgi:hypothetical protein